MKPGYARRKAPLILAVLIGHETWRELTGPQRRALLGHKPVHPRTADVLHEKGLWRKDGRPTAWGRRVVEYSDVLRGEPSLADADRPNVQGRDPMKEWGE